MQGAKSIFGKLVQNLCFNGEIVSMFVHIVHRIKYFCDSVLIYETHTSTDVILSVSGSVLSHVSRFYCTSKLRACFVCMTVNVNFILD